MIYVRNRQKNEKLGKFVQGHLIENYRWNCKEKVPIFKSGNNNIASSSKRKISVYEESY